MLLSCKISNSVLAYLDRAGADLDRLDDLSDLPMEFLRDPHYWVESQRLESFLRVLIQEYGHLSQEPLMLASGHASAELRAWGALDSVIRMLPSTQDLLMQPERLLSYFVSPPPPVGSLRRHGEGIEFDVPIHAQEYPLSAAFIAAAFESLPTFTGGAPFVVHWEEFHFSITWATAQTSLLNEQQSAVRQFKPELIQTVLDELEINEKKVDDLTRQLKLREGELAALKQQKKSENIDIYVNELRSSLKALNFNLDDKLHDALNDIFRLNDYLTRSQQLITLLVGQGRQDSQVKEAMRRTDWEMVQKEFPHLVKSSVQSLQMLSGQLNDFFKQVKPLPLHQVEEESKQMVFDDDNSELREIPTPI